MDAPSLDVAFAPGWLRHTTSAVASGMPRRLNFMVPRHHGPCPATRRRGQRMSALFVVTGFVGVP